MHIKRKLFRWYSLAIIVLLIAVPVVLFRLNRPHACRLVGRVANPTNEMTYVTRSGLLMRTHESEGPARTHRDKMLLYRWDGSLAWSVTFPERFTPSPREYPLLWSSCMSQNGRFVACAISNSPQMRVLVWKDGNALPPVTFPRPPGQSNRYSPPQLTITDSGRVFYWSGSHLAVIEGDRIIAECRDLPQQYVMPTSAFSRLLKGVTLSPGTNIESRRFILSEGNLIIGMHYIVSRGSSVAAFGDIIPGFELASLDIESSNITVDQLQSVLRQPKKRSLGSAPTMNEYYRALCWLAGSEYIVFGTGEIYGTQGLLYPNKGSKPAWFPQMGGFTTDSLQTYQSAFIPQHREQKYEGMPTRIYYPRTGDAWLLPHNRKVYRIRIAENGQFVAQHTRLHSDRNLRLLRRLPFIKGSLSGKSLAARLEARQAILIIKRPNRMTAKLQLAGNFDEPQLELDGARLDVQDFALSPDGSYLLVKVGAGSGKKETLIYAWK